MRAKREAGVRDALEWRRQSGGFGPRVLSLIFAENFLGIMAVLPKSALVAAVRGRVSGAASNNRRNHQSCIIQIK